MSRQSAAVRHPRSTLAAAPAGDLRETPVVGADEFPEQFSAWWREWRMEERSLADRERLFQGRHHPPPTGHPALLILRPDFDGFTHVAPAGEIPRVGKPRALVGLHGLDRAVDPVEEHAFAVGLVDESEAVAPRSQAGIAIDENPFVHSEKVRNGRDVGVIQTHKTRPPAAISAALALIPDGGRGISNGLPAFGWAQFWHRAVRIVRTLSCRGKPLQCAGFRMHRTSPGGRDSCEAVPAMRTKGLNPVRMRGHSHRQ